MAAVLGLTPATAAAQRRHCARTWWLSYTGVLGLSVVVGAIAFTRVPLQMMPRGITPSELSIWVPLPTTDRSSTAARQGVG